MRFGYIAVENPAESPQRVSFDIARHNLLLRMPNERDSMILPASGPYIVFASTFALFGYAESVPATRRALARAADHDGFVAIRGRAGQ
jgi:hypothetical protein